MILVNDFKIKHSNFPAGESHIKFPEELLSDLIKHNPSKVVDFTWHYKDDTELFVLLSAIEKVREFAGVHTKRLFIPYLPHARMDRIKEGTQNLALKVFGDFLNSLEFFEVWCSDVHSDEAYSYIRNLKSTTKQVSLINSLLKANDRITQENTVLIFPDNTAYKRFGEHLTWFDSGIITCDKVRDFNTGKILSTTANIEKEFEVDKITNAIIVDDICSYGGTFDLAIKAISEKYPNIQNYYLSVTHLEESVLMGNLIKNDLLKGIISTDSLQWLKVGMWYDRIEDAVYLDIEKDRENYDE